MTPSPLFAATPTSVEEVGDQAGAVPCPGDDFIVTAEDWSPRQHKSQEALFAQGNGYLQVRASFEEGLQSAPQNLEYERRMESVTVEKQANPVSKVGTFIPAIMGHHPLIGDVTVNLPNFLGIYLTIAGETFDVEQSTISEYARHLDMASGILTRTVVWHTRSGSHVRLTWRRFASWANHHIFAQEVEMTSLSGSIDIDWTAGINADVTTNGYRHFRHIHTHTTPETAEVAVTTDLGDTVAIATTVLGVPIGDNACSDMEATLSGTVSLQQGKTATIFKITSSATSRDDSSKKTSEEEVAASAQQFLCEASSQTWETLVKDSYTVLERLWDRADIVITGAPEVQKKLRWCIYHLLRCSPRSGGQAQICPKGFAGEAYYGRYFWDSEIYLLPFYLHTNPQAAKDLLLYRYHTLDGARANARRYGAIGAKFPWQSGVDGTEQCSLWEYADNELHISADIAYAVVNYVNATGDQSFMDQYGLEILLETARYWTTRVDYDANSVPHLINIMGPDEYSPMAYDNAFTNRMVRFNCHEATRRLADYQQRKPEAAAALVASLGITDAELAQMDTIATTLPIPYDNERKLVLQSADFPTYADIDIDALWTDKSRAFGFSVTQEKIYRSKCIKQADVTALMTLFPQDFSDEEVAAAYDYYTPFVVHDSSLSPAGHSVIAHRLGRDGEVERFLDHALAVDFDQEAAKAGDGIHIANCAMIWQLFVYGIAGLSNAVSDTELTLRPRLLEWMQALSIPVAWGGKNYRFSLTPADNHTTLHPPKDNLS